MSKSSIWPVDKTLSFVTTAGQSLSKSNAYEEVLHIPLISGTEDLPSDCLESYPEHWLVVGVYSSPDDSWCIPESQQTGLTNRKEWIIDQLLHNS